MEFGHDLEAGASSAMTQTDRGADGSRYRRYAQNWAARLQRHPRPTKSALPTVHGASTDSHEGMRIFFAGDDKFCTELQTSVRPVRETMPRTGSDGSDGLD